MLRRIKRHLEQYQKINEAPLITEAIVASHVDSFSLAKPEEQRHLIHDLFDWLTDPWINAKRVDSNAIRRLIIQELFVSIYPQANVSQKRRIIAGIEDFVYHKETLLHRKGELSVDVQIELLHQIDRLLGLYHAENDRQVHREYELIQRRIQMEKAGVALTPAIHVDIDHRRQEQQLQQELHLFFVGMLGYYASSKSAETRGLAREILTKWELKRRS